jgi:hypothetical protein
VEQLLFGVRATERVDCRCGECLPIEAQACREPDCGVLLLVQPLPFCRRNEDQTPGHRGAALQVIAQSATPLFPDFIL